MKQPCPYCGNNPVPHFLYFYNESLNVWFTPLRRMLLYNGLTNAMKRWGFGKNVGEFFFRLALSLGAITIQYDIKACKVRRAKVMWEEAQRRGFRMGELLLFGRPFDCYWTEKTEGQLKKHLLFSGLPRPSGYSNPLLDSMDDKWIFKKIMMQNDLPVSRGGCCWGFFQAKKIFKRIQSLAPAGDPPFPVIVKPRAGSRGRHSTTFVSTETDLKKALRIARQLCYWVMVEEQLFGPVYRATVINFVLRGVLRGDGPEVTGDGRNTISHLVEIKNNLPHEGVKNILLDAEAGLFLSRQGLGFSSIPALGLVVAISEKIGVNYGGSSSEDYDICHPDNKALFEKAARILGDPIVGFDFIIPNITQSYKDQRCGFIEVNTLPFINLHHDPLRGRPRNVAAAVWDMLELNVNGNL